jgi:hypothetical protein
MVFLCRHQRKIAGSVAGSCALDAAYTYASCQPWPEQVVLDGERETLGLYLTGVNKISGYSHQK